MEHGDHLDILLTFNKIWSQNWKTSVNSMLECWDWLFWICVQVRHIKIKYIEHGRTNVSNWWFETLIYIFLYFNGILQTKQTDVSSFHIKCEGNILHIMNTISSLSIKWRCIRWSNFSKNLHNFNFPHSLQIMLYWPDYNIFLFNGLNPTKFHSQVPFTICN